MNFKNIVRQKTFFTLVCLYVTVPFIRLSRQLLVSYKYRDFN